jgi:hypothetical protein
MAAAMTLEAETSDALAVQRPLPDDALRIKRLAQADRQPGKDCARCGETALSTRMSQAAGVFWTMRRALRNRRRPDGGTESQG